MACKVTLQKMAEYEALGFEFIFTDGSAKTTEGLGAVGGGMDVTNRGSGNILPTSLSAKNKPITGLSCMLSSKPLTKPLAKWSLSLTPIMSTRVSIIGHINGGRMGGSPHRGWWRTPTYG